MSTDPKNRLARFFDEERKPRRVESACPRPCAACPWRTENHGKPHKNGWYTARNRVRLWSKLRRGDSMTCHQTDPENPVPVGAKPAPKDATTRECAGGLILQQREIEKVQGFETFRDYVRSSRVGLTLRGLSGLVERFLFGGVPVLGAGAIKMTATNLNEPVSHLPLGEWKPDEVIGRKRRS